MDLVEHTSDSSQKIINTQRKIQELDDSRKFLKLGHVIRIIKSYQAQERSMLILIFPSACYSKFSTFSITLYFIFGLALGFVISIVLYLVYLFNSLF